MNILRLIGLLILALTLSGCNTLAGIGQDIKSAGRSIERAAH